MMTAKNLIDIVQLGEGYQAEFKQTLPSKLKEVSIEEWVKGWVEKLTKNRLMILHCIHENPQISKRETETIVNISGSSIDNNIAFLKKLGLLSRQGGAKGGRWMIHYINPDSE